MAARTYLNVPYVEKDSAKALGAKWDAVNKKWYVSPNVDITPFSRWYAEDTDLNPSISAAENPKPRKNKSSNEGYVGGMTYPIDKNFSPYNGDDPPWN